MKRNTKPQIKTPVINRHLSWVGQNQLSARVFRQELTLCVLLKIQIHKKKNTSRVEQGTINNLCRCSGSTLLCVFVFGFVFYNHISLQVFRHDFTLCFCFCICICILQSTIFAGVQTGLYSLSPPGQLHDRPNTWALSTNAGRPGFFWSRLISDFQITFFFTFPRLQYMGQGRPSEAKVFLG